MVKAREKIAKRLSKYLPSASLPYVMDLLFSESVHFKVTKPRSTKHGDFRPAHKGKPHRITVNGNLNQYAFLLTTIHEFAHLTTHVSYGLRVSAHGKEWKSEFKRLLEPILDREILPDDIEEALKRSLHNMKASTCTDKNLYRALKRYDDSADNSVLLEQLNDRDIFRLGKRVFRRGELRRTRFMCEEINSRRMYLVSGLAEVERYYETGNER
tara:strand:+ start:23058 stop:23696 length:639 start_codon:yes stop_codon:yes gene_type:complete